MRIFQQSYKDKKTGERRFNAKWYVAFVDHNRIARRWPAFEDRKRSATMGAKLERLVECRRANEQPDGDLARWLDGLPRDTVERLADAGLVDPRRLSHDRPLVVLLDGGGSEGDAGVDAAGTFRQHLTAKGNTPGHVAQTVRQVRRVLDGCGFAFWSDLVMPDAVGRAEQYLADLRDDAPPVDPDTGKAKGRRVRGQTAGYYAKSLRQFARWLARQRGATVAPLAALATAVKGADADRVERRPLSVAEMRELVRRVGGAGLAVADRMPERCGLDCEARALLYRFAYESGLRPKSIRGLVVADFSLDADPPTVTARAATTKRGKPHTQTLRPTMVADLRRRFASKVPTATAFRMPNKWRLAEMIRADLDDARARWIADAAKDPKEQLARQRSDFLASKDHCGRLTDFYSLRHTHGTTLGAMGTPQKEIAASMHHARLSTTERYVHGDLEARAAAIDGMPELLDDEPQAVRPGRGRVARQDVRSV